ncbi:LytR/AlgR family response regulator transcription factor [Pseudogracilibacillus sp. SO30301A]|uniref:LytR/AlgR family response regulator transcription factor n=1 Tax=Pseudogracilibacillus sp. SO30301A TaxID=3098291 RepID=UPI00300DE0E9
MDTINVLIVDDERFAREELRFILEDIPNVNIIGEAESGEKAVIQAIQLKPDVVFLDVEMPKMNGIEAAKSLIELKKAPLIVFATAYPQFAAEAFRINAIDYLLKPYDPKHVKQAIDRITQKMVPNIPAKTTESLGKLAVENEGEIEYLFVKDILYFYPKGKISIIITLTNDYEVKSSLKELERRLTPFNFFRIHRSYLVNLNYVVRLVPWFNGAYELELEGVQEKLPVSRNYAKALRKRLDL